MSSNDVKLQVTLYADGRSAVRAFGQVSESSKKAGEQVHKDAKKQKESFEMVEAGTHKLRGAVGTLAGTVGLAGLGFGIADIIKAGQDWQTQQARLQQSLRNTGQYSQRTMEMLNKSAEHTATKGGFAAPEQLQALSQFVRLTGSTSRAVQMNKAAMELARGTGMEYTQTQKMIGQAMTGNTGRLQKYLGIIQPVKTAEFALSQAHQTNIFQMEAQSKALGKLGPQWLKSQEIAHNLTPAMLQHAQLLDRQATATMMLGRIQQRYGGSMSAFSHTTAGAISNAKNSIDLAMEKLGAKALPLVAHVAQAIAGLVTYMSDHRQVLIAFGVALGAIGLAFSFTKAVAAVEALGAALVAFSGAEEGATVGAIAFGTAFRLTIIGMVITVLFLLITHFKQVKAVALQVWHAIVAGANAAFSWLRKAAPSIAKPFVTAFDAVKRAVTGVVNWIWSKFQWVGKQVGKIFHGITSLPGKVLHGAGSALHTITGGILHTGGLVQPKYLASGGPIGTDTVPLWGAPGEFMLRREAVQNIGVQNLNSINATGSIAGVKGGNPDQVYVAAPLIVQAGQRVLAETTLHFAARKNALAGAT